MPRTSSRKRNSRRIDSTVRVTSNLSPNAPEFIPIANDETTANQRENIVIQSMTFCGNSSASNSSGNSSNSTYEATSISSIPDTLKNKGQRDLLINLLNECKVDCVICYERAKNVEQIWNCRNCYQIMHLKCVIVWFVKSHRSAIWRCPACQCEVIGKPKYMCFCGTVPNPYHNNVDIPHSCGQVCGLQKKNPNLDYDDCHHKCTLLCHPGPCPQCVVQVLRSCGCGKKRIYALCGQSTKVVCNNVCLKKLNCQIHECEKMCHADSCGPCNKGCPQNLNVSEEILAIANERFANAIYQYEVTPPDSTITEEELRILGLNPAEVFRTVPIYPTDRNNEDVNNDDFILDDSDLDIDPNEMRYVDHEIRFQSNGEVFPMIVQFSRNLDDHDDLSLTSGDDTEEEIEEFEDEESSSLSGEDFDEHYNSNSTDSSSRFSPNYVREQTPQPIMDSDQSVTSWDLNEDSIGSSPDAISSLESIPNDNSSYSEDSTSSSGSNINYLNDTNSSGSTTSSSSSPTSSSSN